MRMMPPLPRVCTILLPISHVRFFYLSVGANLYADPEILVEKMFKVVSNNVCVLLCFINPILGNRFVRSRGFIVSEPREMHPRSEIADVPTSPCPPLDNLGCPDPHPPT